MAGWGDALKSMGDQGSKVAGLAYTPSEGLAGIKETLSTGADYGASVLSQPGGFSKSPETTLALPSSLSGLGEKAGLLSALNSAAEDSIPGTSSIFADSIKNLSVSNPTSAIGGGDSGITQYFESASRTSLKKAVKPIVAKSIKAAGVDNYLSALTAMQKVTGGTAFDATDYLTDKTLDSMFHYMSEKESSLRSSGGAGASALLQKIF
jgi:hypothetical protein